MSHKNKHPQTPVQQVKEAVKEAAVNAAAVLTATEPVADAPVINQVLAFAETTKNIGWADKDAVIPAVKTETTDQLLDVPRKQFPRTKAGKMAYCDYQLLVWQARKEFYGTDPSEKTKLESMLAREEAKLTALKAKLAALK